jgi:hypothetical protein
MTDALHRVLLALLIFVVVAFIPTLAMRLLMSGGRPRSSNGAYECKLRPGMRVLAIVIALVAAWIVMHALLDWRQPKMALAAQILGGCALGVIPAFILNARVLVDEEGLHYQSAWKSVCTIAWSDMVCYQVQYNSQTGSRTYLYRSRDGSSIPVEQLGYDTDDLLKRVLTHVPLKEEPYQRRHWYGG